MTRSQRLPRGLFTLVLPLGLCSGPLLAQDDKPFDRTPQDCLVTYAIDRTDIIDDQTILFYMRDNRVFRNYLPRECPGLAREDRFMYETHTTRLCSIDLITVLEQWGSRFQPGFTCRLGDFHPMSPEEVEDLEALGRDGVDRDDGLGRDSIEASPAELPADDAAAEPDAETPADADE
jgi:hypothetical protein